MNNLLANDIVNSEELEALLKTREEGNADFLLVDVREDMEYDAGHIKGVDMLKPTSIFAEWAETLIAEAEGKAIIFTCRTSARSGQVQYAFKENGHERAINHIGGIVTYRGEIER